ncbi:MAG: FkbM family methyltransferase [Patescibacteria group bacterium]|nr:FkbM family methyltransferase [Patescibacteria group bacterium]
MIRQIILKFCSLTHLDHWIIKIKKGPGKGIKWTLLPYSMYWRGETEKEMDKIIDNLNLKTNAIIWDLGAHFGYYSLIFARLATQGKVYAFEPDPEAFKRLLYHLKINRTKNVQALRLAVGEKNKSVFLGQKKGAGEPTNKIAAQGLSMKMAKLDSLVQQKKIKKPDLIKIDIEGYGGEAVLGSLKTIRKQKPILIFSFHNDQEIKKTRKILEPLGYKAFSITKNIVEWNKILETVFLATAKISYNKKIIS